MDVPFPDAEVIAFLRERMPEQPEFGPVTGLLRMTVNRLCDRNEAMRAVLTTIISAQTIGPPYQGWNITALNKAIDEARALFGLPPACNRLTPEQCANLRAAVQSFQSEGDAA